MPQSRPFSAAQRYHTAASSTSTGVPQPSSWQRPTMFIAMAWSACAATRNQCSACPASRGRSRPSSSIWPSVACASASPWSALTRKVATRSDIRPLAQQVVIHAGTPYQLRNDGHLRRQLLDRGVEIEQETALGVGTNQAL